MVKPAMYALDANLVRILQSLCDLRAHGGVLFQVLGCRSSPKYAVFVAIDVASEEHTLARPVLSLLRLFVYSDYIAKYMGNRGRREMDETSNDMFRSISSFRADDRAWYQ